MDAAFLALTDGPSEQSACNWAEEASVTLGSSGSEIVGGVTAPYHHSPAPPMWSVMGEEARRSLCCWSGSPMHPQMPAPKRDYGGKEKGKCTPRTGQKHNSLIPSGGRVFLAGSTLPLQG